MRREDRVVCCETFGGKERRKAVWGLEVFQIFGPRLGSLAAALC